MKKKGNKNRNVNIEISSKDNNGDDGDDQIRLFPADQIVLSFFSLVPFSAQSCPRSVQSAKAAELCGGEPLAAAGGRPSRHGEHPAGVRAAEPLLHLPGRGFGLSGIFLPHGGS